MEFCPKCGSVILVNEKRKASCAKCNFRPKGIVKIQASEKIERSNKIAVIDEKKMTTYPKIEIKCSDCKHNEAYFWTLQTRASDESETKFYRCTKCGNTWRDYR